MTALHIAADVTAGATSAREVVTSALIAVRGNTALNAFTSTFDERALARAARIDAQIGAGTNPGPLAGVPFAQKITSMWPDRSRGREPP